MKSLRAVGFVAPPLAWLFGHHQTRASRITATLALMLTACGLCASSWALLQARAELAERASQSQAAPPSLDSTPKPDARPALNAAQRSRINRAVKRLNSPWGAIFASLESHAVPQIAVLSVEPNVEKGAVRMTTEGPSLDELLRHAARLQWAPPFSHTQLLRVEPEDAPAGSGRFRLSFDLSLAP